MIKILRIFIALLLSCWAFSGFAQQEDTQVSFLKNQGQVRAPNGRVQSEVLYEVRNAGASVFLTTNGLTYYFLKPAESNELSASLKNTTLDFEFRRADVQLIGAVIKPENVIEEMAADAPTIHFYRGNSSVVSQKTVSRLVVKDIYPNIDWVLYADPHFKTGFKHDFVVHEGGDYRQIKLQTIAPAASSIATDNTFGIKTDLGGFTDKAPVAYADGQEVKVVLEHKESSISYQITALPTNTKTLVIDPINLAWSSYVGGSAEEEGTAVYSNATHIWITGMSKSIDFPVSSLSGAYYSGILTGSQDVFVAQFDMLGKMLWATYYGGSGSEIGQSLYFDGTTLWLTGWTNSMDFPCQNLAGAYNQSLPGGGKDAFLLAFEASGARKWATYYGGTGDESGQSIHQNSAGVWVGGTAQNGMPLQTLAGAYNQPFLGGISDAFLLKFSMAGVRLWATYYGGPGTDVCKGIHSDLNSLWVTGWTNSTSFPLQNLSGAYNQVAGGFTQDSYVLKFSNSGVRQWATYYGGSGLDAGNSIFSDGTSVWVGGSTGSTDFPTLNPGGGAYFQGAPMSGGPIFDGTILKFSSTGVRQWATCYGGSGHDDIVSISKVGAYVWFGGLSASTNLPLQSLACSYQRNFFEGTQDAFLLRFNSNTNVRDWATFYGGNGTETNTAICSDTNYLWVTGGTSGATFPIQASAATGAYNQAAKSGINDAFISKFPYTGGAGATFSMLPRLCTYSAPIDLSLYVSPTGGTFSGTGVTGGHFFDPSVSGAGSFPIIYSYSGGACSDVVTQVAVVSTTPAVTGGTLTVCSTMGLVDLRPHTSPAGGTFSGVGVVGGHWLDASSPGPSTPRILTYTYTNPSTGCYGTSSLFVFIVPGPTANLDSLPSVCVGSPVLSLLPYSSPAGGTFYGTGVSGTSFSPATAGIGSHTISYIVGGGGCYDTATRVISVMPSVSVVATSMPSVCVGSAPIDLTLYVSPPGGTFSGAGVSGTTFNPITAGSFPVFYTVTSACGSGIATLLVTVKPKPSVFAGVITACSNWNPIDLRPYGVPTGGIFAGLGVSGHFFDPSSPGPTTPRTLTYTYTDPATGCSNTANLLVYIVAGPEAVISPLPAICLGSPPFSLLPYGTPVGGTFSGAGVVGSTFNPATAGLGVHTIRYITSGTCADTAYSSITVGTGVSIATTTPPTLCLSSTPLNLNTFVTPLGGVFSGTGVSGSTFNPAMSGVGTFTVTYTYTSPGGCTGSAALTITVNPSPTVTVTAPFPLRICQNAPPISLLSYVSPNTGTFFGSTGLVGTDFDPSLVPPGIYTIAYNYTDCVTGCTASAGIIIQVMPLPTVTMSALPRMCAFNPPLNLTSFATPTGGTFSGIGVTGGHVFDPVLAGSGTHSITYTYTDPATGCSKSVRRNITVGASGGATFGPLPDVCVNSAAFDLSLYTSVDVGAFSGPGVSGSTFNPGVAGVGTHTLTYVLPGSSCLLGCGDTLRARINVKPVPNVPWISGATFVCRGQIGTFVAGGSVPSATYEWFTTPTGGSPIHAGAVYVTPPQLISGVVVIWAQATLNGCSSPRVPFCYVVRPCSNTFKTRIAYRASGTEDVNLVAQGTMKGKIQYIWLLNGDTLKSQTRGTLSVNKSGYYQVLTTDESGEVAVSESFEVQIGETERHDGAILYPNPNRGQFTVEYHKPDLKGQVKISIWDLSGRAVHTQSAEASGGQLSVPVQVGFLSAGTYTLLIETEGLWLVEKYVKQ